MYPRRNLQLDEMNVWGFQKPLIVDALYVLDNKMIYASIESKRSIVTIILEHDGVGICGKEELLLTFLADWVTVTHLIIDWIKLLYYTKMKPILIGTELLPVTTLQRKQHGVIMQNESTRKVYRDFGPFPRARLNRCFVNK